MKKYNEPIMKIIMLNKNIILTDNSMSEGDVIINPWIVDSNDNTNLMEDFKNE